MVLRVTEILTQNCLRQLFSHIPGSSEMEKISKQVILIIRSTSPEAGSFHGSTLQSSGFSPQGRARWRQRFHTSEFTGSSLRGLGRLPPEAPHMDLPLDLTVQNWVCYTLIPSKRRRGKDYPAWGVGPCFLEKLLGGESAGNVNKMGGERWKRVF